MGSVLLINPPYTRYGRPAHIQPDEPMGLLALAAYVREQGHRVRILDALVDRGYYPSTDGFYKSGLSDDELRAALEPMERPDVVGIASMFTMHSRGVHDAAAVVKQVWPDVLLVVGGSHASALPDWVLEDRNIDLVVRGEGEVTLMEILERACAASRWTISRARTCGGTGRWRGTRTGRSSRIWTRCRFWRGTSWT